MKTALSRLRGFAYTTVGGLAAAFAVHADPDEAWVVRANLPPGVPPLLALIIDRSDATAAMITVGESYDASRDYGSGLPAEARCNPALAYWRRGPGPAQDCVMQSGLELAPGGPTRGLHCVAALGALAQQGFFIASRAAQWRPSAAGGHWSALQAGSHDVVECRSDRGRHGAGPGAWYATDGPHGPWSEVAAAEISWQRSPHADPYIFYHGNFLNFLRSVRLPVERSIADVISEPLAAALDATDELEAALIRTNDHDGAAGGYVARAPIASRVAAGDLRQLTAELPAGDARLAETLTEAAAWLSGGAVRFGDDARADRAALDPLAAGRYRSPFTHACRPVTLAYLSGGQVADHDLAAATAQIAQADFRDDLPGAQLAAYDSVSGLDDPLAFVNLVARSLQHDAAVPAGPRLSAAAILPVVDTGDAPGVAFGLTAPRVTRRWGGNLLRYALRAPASPFEPPTITDRDGEAAIDAASGLPRSASRSLWSDAPDANLLTGSAAGRLPAADARRLYSNLASARILEPANSLAPGNPRIDRATLGLGSDDAESAEEILSWLAEQRVLGDPGLHSPLIVDYPTSGQRLVFAATHDGLLHAFDADSGVEQWAWMPLELLPRLAGLMRNEATAVRDHGIDGPLVTHRHDPDGDGRIDVAAGEHLWLMFGLGRGGNRYYALDISVADDPQLLWSVAPAGSTPAEAWPEPVIARLAIADSGQSNGHWVVLLAGGYDRQFDSAGAPVAGAGNALHVLDALTGRALWRGAGDADADQPVPDLAVSLPSAPRVLDLDGNGQLDRAYLVDVAGGLWRFDFANGRTASELVEARLLARLGTGTQRFHATPDVSLARLAGRTQVAIAVGSGWLARPRDAGIVDRIYTVFDRASSGGSPVLTEADLYDATEVSTAMPALARGWYRRLERHGSGEKVVGPVITFNHMLRFQTYQPLADAEIAPCGPPRAIHRMHAFDIRSGLLHASSVEWEADDEEEPAESGLPVALRFAFPVRWDPPCTGCRPRPFGINGAEVFDPGYAGDPVKTSWRKLDPPLDSR